MITIRDRYMPGNWRVALVEDNKRNRYIVIEDPLGKFVQNVAYGSKLYKMYDALLLRSPTISDQDLMALYDLSTHGITETRGRVLAYARAVIELTRKSWGMN
jgi:hypothetical protein